MSVPRYLTIEEQIALPSAVLPYIFQTTISPEGRYVTYTRRTAPPETPTFSLVTFLYDRLTGKTTCLEGNESWSARWTAGGELLCYVSRAGDRPQVFGCQVASGQTTRLTEAPEGVERYRVSGDGQRLYYTAALPDPLQRRNDEYGVFTFVDQEPRRNALFVLDRATGSTTQLTRGTFYVGNFDLAPDGHSLVLCGAPGPGRHYREQQNLYLLDAQTGALRQLPIPLVTLIYPVFWSPDGTAICYTYFPDGKFFLNNVVEILDVQSGARRRVEAPFDQDLECVAWTPRGILFTYAQRTNRHVGLWQPEDALRTLVEGAVCLASAPSLTSDGAHLVYAKATENRTVEVFVDDEPITDTSAALEGKPLSRKSLVQWRSADGLEIEGILSLPVDYRPGQRYPLLVIAHGGPKGVIPLARTFQDFYPTEQFVARGFAVLEPNYRGSDGYGEAFRCANLQKWGPEDYDDVVGGVDELVAQGYADPIRLGVMGWSQGGHIAAFCGVYGDRFKAVSVGAGVSHWRTNHLMADNIISDVLYFGGAPPWDDPALYDRASAITYLDRARTPMLIQHGENDARVPVANAYELHRALRDRGVPVEFVLFKNQGHVPENRSVIRAIMAQNLAWFCHYLLGEPLEGPFWKQTAGTEK